MAKPLFLRGMLQNINIFHHLSLSVKQQTVSKALSSLYTVVVQNDNTAQIPTANNEKLLILGEQFLSLPLKEGSRYKSSYPIRKACN